MAASHVQGAMQACFAFKPVFGLFAHLIRTIGYEYDRLDRREMPGQVADAFYRFFVGAGREERSPVLGPFLNVVKPVRQIGKRPIDVEE
jgi:hypothetical protein